MIEWLNGKLAELTGTLQVGGTVLAIAIVAYAYAKARTLVALLVAGLTAGVFIWLINSGSGWFSDRVGDETNEGAHRAVVQLPQQVALPGDPVVIETPDTSGV